VELQNNLQNIRAEGLEVVAISYDSVAVLKNFADRRSITFPLLSDPESKIIRDFDILNEQAQPGTPQYGIPYPGTYLLDRAGRVTEKYFEDDYTQRYTSADILVRHFGASAGAAHTTAEGKHLRLSASASNEHVRSGQRISLVLDVTTRSPAPRLCTRSEQRLYPNRVEHEGIARADGFCRCLPKLEDVTPGGY